MLVDPQIHQLLDSVSTMTLSTCGQDGPHAAPVYFASDDRIHLYFFSEMGSLHSRHSAQNPQAAAAIYPYCESWQDIRGLQLYRDIQRVQARDEWDMAWDLYRIKFPFVKALKAIVAKNQLYAFIPTWIRLVDNDQGFGYKQEWKRDCE